MALIDSAAVTSHEPAVDHREWMVLADEEYRRLLELLRQLTPEEWHAPTDCDGWDVYALVCHLVGSAEANASVTEAARQLRLGKQRWPDADPIDAMNAVQVSERLVEAPRQLVVRLEGASQRSMRVPRAASWPVRALRAVLRRPTQLPAVIAMRRGNFVRDTWMHRIDLCRATGRPLVLTGDHDGRLVADVVAEWARTHGAPFALELTGPAGGSWSQGAGGESLQLDAVEFARVVSGRGEGSGLLATRVAF